MTKDGKGFGEDQGYHVAGHAADTVVQEEDGS